MAKLALSCITEEKHKLVTLAEDRSGSILNQLSPHVNSLHIYWHVDLRTLCQDFWPGLYITTCCLTIQVEKFKVCLFNNQWKTVHGVLINYTKRYHCTQISLAFAIDQAKVHQVRISSEFNNNFEQFIQEDDCFVSGNVVSTLWKQFLLWNLAQNLISIGIQNLPRTSPTVLCNTKF